MAIYTDDNGIKRETDLTKFDWAPLPSKDYPEWEDMWDCLIGMSCMIVCKNMSEAFPGLSVRSSRLGPFAYVNLYWDWEEDFLGREMIGAPLVTKLGCPYVHEEKGEIDHSVELSKKEKEFFTDLVRTTKWKSV